MNNYNGYSGQILITAGDLLHPACGIQFITSIAVSKSRHSDDWRGWTYGYIHRYGFTDLGNCQKYATVKKYNTHGIYAIHSFVLTGDPNDCSTRPDWYYYQTGAAGGTYDVVYNWYTEDENCNLDGTTTETYVGSGVYPYGLGGISDPVEVLADVQCNGSSSYNYSVSNEEGNFTNTCNATLSPENGCYAFCGQKVYCIDGNCGTGIFGCGVVEWQPMCCGASYTLDGPPTGLENLEYLNPITDNTPRVCCTSDYPSWSRWQLPNAFFDDSGISQCQNINKGAYNLDILDYGHVNNEQYKVRLTHYPSPTCYLKVWRRKVVTNYIFEPASSGNGCTPSWKPNLTGTPSIEELSPYVWDKRNGDCNHPLTYTYNSLPLPVITGEEYEVIAQNGTSAIIEFYKYSLHPDYEPPDNGITSL